MENWQIIAEKKFVNDDWNIHPNFENTFAMNIMNTFCIKHGRGLEDFSFVHSEGFVVVETSEFGNMLSVFVGSLHFDHLKQLFKWYEMFKQ